MGNFLGIYFVEKINAPKVTHFLLQIALGHFDNLHSAVWRLIISPDLRQRASHIFA